MTETKSLTDIVYDKLLSEKTKRKLKYSLLSLAIISFILHLLIITLVDLKIILINDYSKLLNDPISAIYILFPLF
jgi:hypothetical protein